MAKKIYGSVNGAREEAKLAYGSLNGARVRAVKIYGSENGVCKQVYECPYGYITNVTSGTASWLNDSSAKDFHDLLGYGYISSGYFLEGIGKNVILHVTVKAPSGLPIGRGNFQVDGGTKGYFPSGHPPELYFDCNNADATFDIIWYRN